MSNRAFVLGLIIASLHGCVSRPPLTGAAPAPQFDALDFFRGRTEGVGQLRKLFSKPELTVVHGTGRLQDGTLVLDQTVEQGSKPIAHRQWRIHQVATGRYAGTLSDAAGGITGKVSGNNLYLAFKMKGGLTAQQWLILAPDRRSAHNIMTVTKLGMRVAVLDEEIRKID